MTAWRSPDLYQPFEFLGKAITPRSDGVDDWDNFRIQDPDIGYIPELGGYVMTCNMMDIDGNPGGNFPTLKKKQTRVIGVFFHGSIMSESNVTSEREQEFEQPEKEPEKRAEKGPKRGPEKGVVLPCRKPRYQLYAARDRFDDIVDFEPRTRIRHAETRGKSM